jgi:hypothetical protein
MMSGPSSCENMSALGGTRNPSLQIRRFLYGHPRPFRSVRDLGIVPGRLSAEVRTSKELFIRLAPRWPRPSVFQA